MSKIKKEFIECACGSEGLNLEKDEDGLLNIAIFTSGYNGKSNWIYKLKHIWFIIKNGHPYKDFIVLDKKGIQRLKDFLIIGNGR